MDIIWSNLSAESLPSVAATLERVWEKHRGRLGKFSSNQSTNSLTARYFHYDILATEVCADLIGRIVQFLIKENGRILLGGYSHRLTSALPLLIAGDNSV